MHPTRKLYLRTLTERLDHYSMPEPNSGCRLWLGTLSGAGYGMVWDGTHKRGAHIASWELANKRAVTPGMLVCHKCDIRCCIEETHLFEGTYQDNSIDMVAKGRHVPISLPGQSHPEAKATDLQARLIRADTRPARIIASELGVSKSMIDRIRQRKTYRNA